MVLTEAILISAYFLGLRRAYRLVLKTERKVLKRIPRVQQFAERNIKHVFRLAQRGIKEVETRDLAFGRYLGELVDKIPSWNFFTDKSVTRREKVDALKASLRAAAASRRARRAAESGGVNAGEAAKIVGEKEREKWEGKAPGQVIEESVKKGGGEIVERAGRQSVTEVREGGVREGQSSDPGGSETARKEGAGKEARLRKIVSGESFGSRSDWKEGRWRETGGREGENREESGREASISARRFHSGRGLEQVRRDAWDGSVGKSVVMRGRGAVAQFVLDKGGREYSTSACCLGAETNFSQSEEEENGDIGPKESAASLPAPSLQDKGGLPRRGLKQLIKPTISCRMPAAENS